MVLIFCRSLAASLVNNSYLDSIVKVFNNGEGEWAIASTCFLVRVVFSFYTYLFGGASENFYGSKTYGALGSGVALDCFSRYLSLSFLDIS